MSLKDALASMGLAGTTALIAVNFTHPIETWKTRLQVNPKFSVLGMIKQDGFFSLWKGIQAGWLREASYTTIKLGAYGPIRDAIGANKKDAPFLLKFAAGSLVRSTRFGRVAHHAIPLCCFAPPPPHIIPFPIACMCRHSFNFASE